MNYGGWWRKRGKATIRRSSLLLPPRIGERSLAALRVRSGSQQLARLKKWAEQFPEGTWAVENATGLGYLLAQQLVAVGERVLDVQPKLAARVRLLASESTNKNDS